MRKPIIAGNWKMHGSLSQVKDLIKGILKGILEGTLAGIKEGTNNYANVDIVVLPTFLHIPLVQDLLRHDLADLLRHDFLERDLLELDLAKETFLAYGGQNLYLGAQGAFTGEVSGPMLKELGCEYVLVGHSERRTLFHESPPLIAEKFKAAIEAGLSPILCVGETLAQREAGETEKVISEQLNSVIQFAGIDAFENAVIAYEPVWAIGTGLTATPEQAQAVHESIRTLLAQNKVDIAKTICILYGGSMKPDNAASLLAQPDIDGGLIGGASLNARNFLAICAQAKVR